MSNIWGTFVVKFTGKNYQKSPNLVTLLSLNIWFLFVDENVQFKMFGASK